VEDWFHVENFRAYISPNSWDSLPIRVEKNTHSLLDLLDETASGNRNWKIKKKNSPTTLRQISTDVSETTVATFFVLGWVAERLPHLVREIHDRGHEIASHGYAHLLNNQQPYSALKRDLLKGKNILEEILGCPVSGYRAPSFSIDEDVLKVIEECGYFYDSSFNSFKLNGRYGNIDLSSNDKHGIGYRVSENFYELPISNLFVMGHAFPWGGGGYFRLMPKSIFNWGVQSILRQEGAYVFYLHPWEIDIHQPIVHDASRIDKFRHYVGLEKTIQRLRLLLDKLSDRHFCTCSNYIKTEAGDIFDLREGIISDSGKRMDAAISYNS
jgi:polysaccharide deacetylase family protein (PEP-CTERM system associated)